MRVFSRECLPVSSPDLVAKHKPLADELFRRVEKSPLSRSERDLQMSRMLSLLDLAVASHAMTNFEPSSRFIHCGERYIDDGSRAPMGDLALRLRKSDD